MFDISEISKDVFDKISLMFGIEDEENKKIYSKRFKKIYYWFGYKGIPSFLSLVSIVLFFYIFFRIYSRSGFEKTVITLLLIIIITLRGLKK